MMLTIEDIRNIFSNIKNDIGEDSIIVLKSGNTYQGSKEVYDLFGLLLYDLARLINKYQIQQMEKSQRDIFKIEEE